MLGFDKGFQTGQARTPEAAVLVEPRVNGSQWLGIELIDAVASLAMLAYQVGATEQAKMFRDRGPRNRECSCDLSGGLAASPQ
jgi:hypothetical protein